MVSGIGRPGAVGYLSLAEDHQEISVCRAFLTPIPPWGYYGCVKTDKQKLVRHLKIIEGQVRGLQDMIEKDAYCIDVIAQASAVKQGISNVEDQLLEHHLGSCVVSQIKEGKQSVAVDEILKVYRLKRK